MTRLFPELDQGLRTRNEGTAPVEQELALYLEARRLVRQQPGIRSRRQTDQAIQRALADLIARNTPQPGDHADDAPCPGDWEIAS